MSPPGLATRSTSSLRWSITGLGTNQEPRPELPLTFSPVPEPIAGFRDRCSGARLIWRQLPAEARARPTAESRYVLWVNGLEGGQGPARSQPYGQR